MGFIKPESTHLYSGHHYCRRFSKFYTVADCEFIPNSSKVTMNHLCVKDVIALPLGKLLSMIFVMNENSMIPDKERIV